MTGNINTELPNENIEITRRYRRLLRVSDPIIKPDDIKLVRKVMADSIAGLKPEEQQSRALSVIHSLEVARITVEEIGLGRTSLICSLLYESVRKSAITIGEIKDNFGEQAGDIMEGLVKVFDLYQRNTSIETENFRKFLLTFAQDIRVILIIIADRLQTMRTLDRYDVENQIKISSEVSYLYAPMAHRLGLYSIKSEMEDLVMKYTNRDMYKFIAKKLNETKRVRDKYIAGFIEPLKNELEKQGLQFDIKGRTKSINSIHNKMKKQGVEFEQVYDLFAIRVILDSKQQNEKADCWRVYSVVADKYQPNPKRMRDWLSVPKSNGYESLHTTVLGAEGKWVEVQIRSRRMDEVAERGLAAHWKYKGIKGDRGLDMWLSNIREIIDNPELNAIDFIDDFKLNLYDEEVFIFTPKGDLKRLPKGATILDFAFDIHSEVGKKCVGAKVNQKNVSFRHVLQNGDQVEILTSSNQVPKQEWLNIVATSRAKTKLKQALKDIQYKDAEIGKETLARRLKNWKLEFNDAIASQLVKHFKYKSTHDFFCDIANEKLDVVAIKEHLSQLNRKEPELIDQQNSRSAENFVKTKAEITEYSSEVLIIDKSLTNVDYKLAKCCNPIFGDEVFGFVTVSGGIKIHRTNCPNASEMRARFGYRIVKAQWTGEAGSNYLAAIKVIGDDDIGIVSNISQVISKELKLKVRSISVDSNGGLFEGTVTVFVNNNQVLTTLIKKVKSIKGVLSVSRIDSIA